MNNNSQPKCQHRRIAADSFRFLRKYAGTSNKFDFVLADPLYDYSEEKKAELLRLLTGVCRGAVALYAPPENLYRGKCQYIFWTKPTSTKNVTKRYSRFVEVIQIFGTGAWNHDRHWSNYTNVWTDIVDDARLHQWRKPPPQIERLIYNHTNAGDCVLDPFAGSHIVEEVCRRMGRSSLSIEWGNQTTGDKVKKNKQMGLRI